MENPPKPLKFAPKIALAVCIGMLDDNYKKVAYHLNDKGELRSKSRSKSVIRFYKVTQTIDLGRAYCSFLTHFTEKLDTCLTNRTV